MLSLSSRMAPFALAASLFCVPAVQSGPARAETPQTSHEGLSELIGTIGAHAIDEEGVPGLVIAVVKDGDVLASRGFGYADAARADPATPTTSFPIGSFAHAMTAAAVLQLVEAKKLALDDDVAKLLPEFPVGAHALKLQHLLANTSGVPGWRKLHAKHADVATRAMDAAEFLALYKDVPFDFEPGTAYSLDTTGYVLLGRIVERVSGEALPEYLKHQLFAPIGLSNTSVCPTDARPVGYAADCKEIQDTRDLDVPMPASPYAGDQSLCSTALDLAMWMHAVYDQHAFGDPLTQALSTSARFANGEATGASYAMTLGNLGDSAWVAHSGGVGGFRVAVAHYARLHTSVVVLANCASAKVEAFEHEIACHLLGLPSPSTREPKLAAQEIAAFVGNYQIATTRVRISTNAGKLFFEWPTGAPVELRYRGAMTFAFVGESDTKLVFRVEEGKVVSFELTRAGSVSTGRRME